MSGLVNLRNLYLEGGIYNGLPPDGTKPLPEPVLTNHRRCIVASTWVQYHKGDIIDRPVS